MKYFEKEMLKYFKSHRNDINMFVLEHWKENHSQKSFNYYLQEVILIKTGIVSINILPYKNGFIPSITFNKGNIYKHENETKYLSSIAIKEKSAEIKIANYIIKYCLCYLRVKSLKKIL